MEKELNTLNGIVGMYTSLLKACQETGGDPSAFYKLTDLDHMTVLSLLEHLGPNHIVFAYQAPEAKPVPQPPTPPKDNEWAFPDVIVGKVVRCSLDRTPAKKYSQGLYECCVAQGGGPVECVVDVEGDDGYIYRNLFLESKLRVLEGTRVSLIYMYPVQRWSIEFLTKETAKRSGL